MAHEILEMIIGFLMMFTAWITIFIVILFPHGFSHDMLIAISLICYALTIIGFAIGMHGLFSLIATRRLKRIQSSQ